MSSANTIKFSTGVIITLFLLFTLFLRTYHLGYSSLWIDEGYSINASLSILEKGVPELDSGSIYKQGLLYNYISAFLMKTLDFDPSYPITPRIPAVIFGFLSIFAIFLLTKTLFNKNIALLSAFILGLSTWQIAWSQQARGYTGIQLFIILSLYFLYIFLKHKKPIHLLFFALSFLCAYLNHTIAIVFVPAYFMIFLFWIILNTKQQQNNLSIKSSFKFFLSSTAKKMLKGEDAKTSIIKIATVTLSLAIFLVIIHNSLPSITVYGFSKNYLAFIKSIMPVLTIIATIGIMQGLISKKYFWPTIFLFTAFVIPFIIILEYAPMVHIRYLFPLFFVPVIFFSFAVYNTQKYIIGKIEQKTKKSIPSVTKPLFSILLSTALLFPLLTFIPQKHYPLFFGSPQPNFKEAYRFIKENKTEEDIVISPYTHLNKIYLQDIGILLPISLSGKTSQTQAIIERGFDYYTNAPVIESKEHLLELITNNTGFIVLDEMATKRLKNQFQEDKIFHFKIREVYHSGIGLNAIWLYQF